MYDNEKILLNYLAKNINDIFEESYKSIEIFEDSIAFAYGWLMLAFSIDDKFLRLKLEKLNENKKTTKDCSFVKYPIIQIAKTLSIDFDIISLCKIKVLEDKRNIIVKLLVNRFNQFLIEFHNQRLKFNDLDIDQRKKSIEKLIMKITE